MAKTNNNLNLIVVLFTVVVLTTFSLSNAIPTGYKYDETDFELAGDIILPKGYNIKSGLIDERFRWPGGIVYYALDTNFTTLERVEIFKGLNEIESNTCIKFKPRTNEISYIYFVRGGQGSGCISELGYQSGTWQRLNLEPPHCIKSGIIAHETIHALGFWHEHMRTDRDDYVTVNYNNIDQANYKGFEKQNATEIDDYGILYDYESIMHYFWNEWAVNSTIPSIIPKKPDAILGGAVLTPRDVLKINRMYAKFCNSL